MIRAYRNILFLVSFIIDMQAATSIGIISDVTYCGERELGWRIKIAAESLGWHAILDEGKGRTISKRDNLDWVICLLPDNRYPNPYCPNYLTIFHPFNYLEANGRLKSFYERYSGYLLTINPTSSLSSHFPAIGKELFFTQFYPTIQPIPYTRVALKELMTMIPVWSNRKTDAKYKNLYMRLSLSGFTKFYGINKNQEIIRAGYMGSIPFDGTSVINVLQQHGIVLILHSDIHNKEAIPSSRIFEAAAASTVIISDENGFVKNNFGDSVFYIDTTLSSEKIYAQIQCHMETIRSDPEGALKMAERAHQIFVDNFLMTDQLLRLEAMHQQIKSQVKNGS